MYTAITHWMNSLAHRDPSIHDKLFAIKGELINNHSHVVEVDKGVFNIPTTAVHIPTTAAILAAIAADPNITEMGPYAAGDANVDTVKVRKICPVPHKLGACSFTTKRSPGKCISRSFTRSSSRRERW